MKANRFNGWIRIILVLCAAALVAVLFVPMWRIELSAPQYPEGLVMLIYPDKLGGNIDIINGLNHYIGMKTLHTADFIEFTVLPYIIAFFALAFLLVGLSAKKKLLYLLFILFIAFAVLAMVDFWRWEYNYGHHLNPDAAIIVPGMAYQPPLLGYKQLLNFGAYSVPAKGGWIFIAVAVVLLLCTIKIWRGTKKNMPAYNFPVHLIAFILLPGITSCASGPQPITAGKDNCHFCKMGISDVRFGAEIVTGKGKVFKFDDTHCLLEFLKKHEISTSAVKNTYLVNYSEPHQLILVDQVFLLKSELLRSPMEGNIAAFDNSDSLAKIQQLNKGNRVTWNDLNKP